MVGLQILGISEDGRGFVGDIKLNFCLKGELPGDHTGWYCGFPFGGWHSVFLDRGILNWTFSLKGELPGDHTGWYCGFPFGGWHSVFLSYIV